MNFQAPVGAEYAAPMGLEFGLSCGFTTMPCRRRYGSEVGWVMAGLKEERFN